MTRYDSNRKCIQKGNVAIISFSPLLLFYNSGLGFKKHSLHKFQHLIPADHIKKKVMILYL